MIDHAVCSIDRKSFFSSLRPFFVGSQNEGISTRPPSGGWVVSDSVTEAFRMYSGIDVFYILLQTISEMFASCVNSDQVLSQLADSSDL